MVRGLAAHRGVAHPLPLRSPRPSRQEALGIRRGRGPGRGAALRRWLPLARGCSGALPGPEGARERGGVGRCLRLVLETSAEGAALLGARGKRRSPASKMWVAPREDRPREPRGTLTARLRKGWEREREGFSCPGQVFVLHVRGLATCGPGRRPPLRIHSPRTRGPASVVTQQVGRKGFVSPARGAADPLDPGQKSPGVRSPRGRSVARSREGSGDHASVPRIWGQPTDCALNSPPMVSH